MVQLNDLVVGFLILFLLALLVVYLINVYNQLIRFQRRCDQAKQNIDVLLQQRQDELTKLIDAVEEYMDHEEELLESLTEARERAERAATPSEEANADHRVREALASFRARAEEYPELRSQGNMRQFQDRIADIESQIADRREVYNEAVTEYNIRTRQVPYVVLARILGFRQRDLFTADESATTDVDVSEQFS